MITKFLFTMTSLSVLALCLAACQDNAVRATSTVQQTVMPITMIPTISVPATATSTSYPATPTAQASPDVFHKPIAEQLIFSKDKNCTFPCWYGLVVGKTRYEQVEPAFRRALGLPQEYRFAMFSLPNTNDLGAILSSWQLPEGDDPQGHLLTIAGTFNRKSGILNTLSLNWAGYKDYPFTSKRVMQELGAPVDVWADLFLTEYIGVGILRAKFFYPEKRIAISLTARVPVESYPDGNMVASWCLDGGRDYEELSGDLLILSPDSEETDSTNAGEHLRPLATVFKMTPSTLYDQAMKDTNSCLKLSILTP